MTQSPAVTIIAADFVTTGGMDWANYALATYLARCGHPVRLVGFRVARDLADLPGVTVVPVRKPLNSYFLGDWWLDAAGRRISREFPARVIVNGGNCPLADVNWVHYVHSAYRPTISGSPLRRLKSHIERPLNCRAERHALQKARFIIANSQRTRRDIIEHCDVPDERIHVVYYGTDPNRFRPASHPERESLREKLGWRVDHPVMLFIGALGDRRKGFDTLFEAWSRLCRSSGWDAVLGVIGRGAELPVWQERVKSAGLGERIRFLGFRSDVPDLLRAADAFVAPTRYEAYGLGVHEALCCGLPAFVSASAGVAERYPPELAELLLPDSEDAVDLAARLERWRSNIQASAERVARMSDTLRQWTWDDMSRSIWERVT